jgi:membrane-bound inhibitor of C-type lysozyme
LLGAAQAHAAPLTERYACDARQSLVVVRSPASATVRFIDRTYELQRKRSSLGEKYGSPTAALIIDGSSAVFVADDRLQLGACVKALETAQAK